MIRRLIREFLVDRAIKMSIHTFLVNRDQEVDSRIFVNHVIQTSIHEFFCES